MKHIYLPHCYSLILILTAICMTPGAAMSEEADTTVAVVTRPFDELPSDLPTRHAPFTLPDVYTPPPADISYHSIISEDREISGSVSRGSTSYGHLDGAVKLVHNTDYHYVVSAHRHRITHYGTTELLALIRESGHALHQQFDGSRLALGNMSIEHGGDIRWSRSHNSGRDMDIAFFMEREDGTPIMRVPNLITVQADGTSRYHGGWRFDVQRNWALIETLITSHAARVQWIFVYEPIRNMLLDYAREHHVEQDIIEAAERILHQPSDSARHDDHFHVRLYCSYADRLEGCIDWGPRWSHISFNHSQVDARVRELLRGLQDPDTEIAEQCISFIRSLLPRHSATTIAKAVSEQTPHYQLELLSILKTLGQPGVSSHILPIVESSNDAEVRARVLEVVGAIGDREAIPQLIRLARSDGPPVGENNTPLQAAAVDALRHMYPTEYLETLIDMIPEARPAIRKPLLVVLRRTTGHAMPETASTSSTASAKNLHSWWSNWYEAHHNNTRLQWLEEALEARGYEVGHLEQRPNYQALIDALSSEHDYIAYLADRLLNRTTKYWSPAESWSQAQREYYWRRKLATR